MATDASFAAYVVEQIALPGRVDVRKMFGEYAVYLDGKVVALLCDDQLFVKPLEPLRERLGRVDEAAPYPGAKPHFRITDQLEDSEALRALLLEAARHLPVPKPGAKKKAAGSAKTAKGAKRSKTATTAKPRKPRER